MKTLVIHPEDPTTHFLDAVYIETDWTIVTDNLIRKSKLVELISNHDRIIMLGHGTGHGLIGKSRYMIDPTYVYLLRDKDLVCMWCNADLFVELYGLKGFYTGMIISEDMEAEYCKVPYAEGHVNESNVLFTKALTESIQNTPKDMYQKMREIYVPSPNNEVMEYNAKRLYYL